MPDSTKSELVKHLIKLAENDQPEEYIKFFTDDAIYQIGNWQPVIGGTGIIQLLPAILQKIDRVNHNIKHLWEVGDTVICEAEVTYTRKDGKVFSVPNLNLIHFTEDKIDKYQAFIDASVVFY